MTPLESLAEDLGVDAPWEDKLGSQWLQAPEVDVRTMASAMSAREARFVTITAQQEEGGIRLDYHWDLKGQLLTIVTRARDNSIASIFDLCAAADWIEREIHEYFAVDFANRPHEPLLLGAGSAAGVNLRSEDE